MFFLRFLGFFAGGLSFLFRIEAKNLMRVVNGLKETTCFFFRPLLKSGFVALCCEIQSRWKGG